MNNNLRRLGIGLLAFGILMLNVSFFNVFKLTGKCPDGVDKCAEYELWSNTSKIGILLVFIGSVVLIIELVKHKSKK